MTPGQTIRVLHVDDDPMQARTYKAGLEARDVSVQLCRGPQDALAEFAAKPFPFDVLILDLWMPAAGAVASGADPRGLQTGQRLYAKFRELEHTQPVILLSNVLEKLDRETLQKVPGVVVLLDKGSTRPSDLYEAITKLLTASNAASDPVPPKPG